MTDKHKELLELICEYAGCDYISDLRGTAARERILAAVSDIDGERFPVEQWRLAIAYITQADCDVATPAQAKEFLQAFAGKKFKTR